MLENINLEIAQIADIEGVLALQDLYLVSNLNEEQKKNGFVTTPFSVEQLKYVIGNEGLFLAKVNGKIIAYIFAESWRFFNQYSIFEYMITLFDDFKFENFKFTTTNSFQYGPVCIHQDFRGKGLLNLLFEFMRIHIEKKYPMSLTFINKTNIPSTKAHVEKLKWAIVGDFQFNNNDYWVLAYNMKATCKL